MKKILTVLAAISTLMATSAPALCQTVNVGAKGGYVTPTGDFSDTFDGALTGGFYVEYVHSPFLAVQGSWLWHKHDASEDLANLRDFLTSAELGVEALTDTRITMNELSCNARLSYPMTPVTPYLLAGAGLFHWKLDGKEIVGDFSRSQNETFWDWGINFGGGASFRVTDEVSLGGEVVYTHVFDEFDNSFFSWLMTVSYGFSLGGR